MTDERKIDRSELLDFRATLRAAVSAATKRLSYLPFGEVSAIIKTLEGQVDELDDILGGLMGGCEGCDSPLYATDEYYTDEDGCSTCMECAPTDEDLEPTPQQGAEVPEGEGWLPISDFNLAAGITYQFQGPSTRSTFGPNEDIRWQTDWTHYRILESEEGERVVQAGDTLHIMGAGDLDGTYKVEEEIEPSTGGEEDGPLEVGASSSTGDDTTGSKASDPLNLAGAPTSPPEPTSANAYWGQRYQPASEEQKQGSTEAQSPLTDDQLTHIGKGA